MRLSYNDYDVDKAIYILETDSLNYSIWFLIFLMASYPV